MNFLKFWDFWAAILNSTWWPKYLIFSFSKLTWYWTGSKEIQMIILFLLEVINLQNQPKIFKFRKFLNFRDFWAAILYLIWGLKYLIFSFSKLHMVLNRTWKIQMFSLYCLELLILPKLTKKTFSTQNFDISGYFRRFWANM